MFGLFRKDPFEKALSAYGFQNCSVAENHLNIGLPPYPPNTAPLTKMPAAPRHVGFFAAPIQKDLVSAFADAPCAQSVQHLFLGTSHLYAEKKMGGWSFAEVLAALRGHSFPKVTSLQLGDMEMLFNGERLFGDLGDIGFVFEAFPALEQLDLYGSFALGAPTRHARLQSLSVQVDDIHVGQDDVSQDSLNNLIASSFPALQELDMDVDDGSETLDLPDEAVLNARFPALRALALNGTRPAQSVSVAVHIPKDRQD